VTLPPAVDLELPGNCKARPAAQQVQEQLSAFIAAVHQATNGPVALYIGASFEHAYPVAEKSSSPLSVHGFLVRPSGPWCIWQVDGCAHVHGIRGNVDLDIINRSPATG
jgi:lysozyme